MNIKLKKIGEENMGIASSLLFLKHIKLGNV
jgi:hypothetical protein